MQLLKQNQLSYTNTHEFYTGLNISIGRVLPLM